MKDYRLHHQYVSEFGLTFLPSEIHEDVWDIATELMTEALQHGGPAFTAELIVDYWHHLPKHRKAAAKNLST